jgi:divalent anion:Na+ symporter, DASS family
MSSSGTAAAQQAPMHFDWNRIARLLAPILIGCIIWFLPTPEGLQPKALQIFAIFVATIVGIMVTPLAMSAVAIIGATIAALLGVIPFSAVVDSTGTDLVWLVILAFFISRGVIKTGLGRRVALIFMRFLGRTTIGLGYGLGLTELVIAPAMPSITARAGGVILPIAKAISEVLGSHPDEATRHRAGNYLILCGFHANIISASMFITAMAGNPLSVKLAADQGVTISWLDWAVAAFVPGIVCLALIPWGIRWLSPPGITRTRDAPALAVRELAAMGPLSRNEAFMAAIFLGLLVLWVLGETLGVGATLAAAVGVSLMFLLRIIDWQDALDEKAAWDTMIWIGLLIMLASKLNEYGMVKWFGSELGIYLEGYRLLVIYALVAAVYLYSHYFFASATAHISALFPVSLALMIAAGVPAFPAAIALGCLSNVCGCLTQYAIGSAPVMFGSGYVSQGEWWRVGFIMSVIYLAVFLIIGPLWWKLIGLY